MFDELLEFMSVHDGEIDNAIVRLVSFMLDDWVSPERYGIMIPLLKDKMILLWDGARWRYLNEDDAYGNIGEKKYYYIVYYRGVCEYHMMPFTKNEWNEWLNKKEIEKVSMFDKEETIRKSNMKYKIGSDDKTVV